MSQTEYNKNYKGYMSPNHEEVNHMPRGDGTGPMGVGSMTGRGLGTCVGANTAKYGAGFGMRLGLACRRGFGRGFGRGLGYGRGFTANQDPSKTQEELLKEEKDFLQSQLEIVDKQLEDL